MGGGLGFLASATIQRRHCRSLIKFLSRLQISPVNLHPQRQSSSDQDFKGSRLFPKLPPCHGSALKVELVDDESWKVSSALSLSWSSSPQVTLPPPMNKEIAADDSEEPFNFDEIEGLRLKRKLFYKIDKGSMENEECCVNLFTRQKSKSKKKTKLSEDPDPLPRENPLPRERKLPLTKVKVKRERVLTFNQSTDPYHLPFCLDVFITKGSVRACIIHRATSKVVSVAHSISKDMKFDLRSRRDAAACAAVGSALAQRALSDDIHNVVFSPRKREKIEGKLEIVLKSIMDAGIEVKVKIKQRKPLKALSFRPITPSSP